MRSDHRRLPVAVAADQPDAPTYDRHGIADTGDLPRQRPGVRVGQVAATLVTAAQHTLLPAHHLDGQKMSAQSCDVRFDLLTCR